MLKKIALLFIVVLMVTCLFTPLVASAIAAAFPGSALPFSRIFDRIALVVLLFAIIWQRGLFPFDLIRQAVSDRPARSHFLALAFGLILTSVTGIVCLSLVVAASPLVWSDKTIAASATKFLVFLPVAILVAIAEECFFRLILYRGLARQYHKLFAAFLSSLFYAFVHFLTPVKQFVYGDLSLTAGCSYFFNVVQQLASPKILLAILGLFLIGLLLCLTIEKTHSLALCAGLHAGWFAVAKVAIYATSAKPAAAAGLLFDKRTVFLSHPIFWSSIVVVFAVLALAFRWWRPHQTKPGNSD